MPSGFELTKPPRFVQRPRSKAEWDLGDEVEWGLGGEVPRNLGDAARLHLRSYIKSYRKAADSRARAIELWSK